MKTTSKSAVPLDFLSANVYLYMGRGNVKVSITATERSKLWGLIGCVALHFYLASG